MATASRGFKYAELKIVISPDTPGRYRVSAASEEAGEASGIMELPVLEADLPAFLQRLAKAVLPGGGSNTSRDGAMETPSEDTRRVDPREFGVLLYHALFSGEVRDILEGTTRAVEGQPDRGLRIRLSFDTARDEMPLVIGLPWELLAKSVKDKPLTVSRRFPLVRALDVARRSAPVAFTPPFTVLVFIATPRGTAFLDLDKERVNLEKQWAGLPNVRTVWRRGTRAELFRSLRDEDPHVLHFMGHGDFHDGRGVLLFETEEGGVDPIDGERLGIALADEPKLRLVFLNACKTAATGLTATSDPFAGVATALVRSGVTAVLAMQFPISDAAAIQFSNTFYECLIKGEPVDGAVGEARKWVYSDQHAEWATPVLFMRSPHGDIFERTDLVRGPTGTFPVQRANDTPVNTAAIPDDAASSVTSSVASSVASVVVHAPTTDVADDFTVFMATTSDRMRPWERRAQRELPAHGITVVTVEPTPLAEHEASVRALAGSADLFVHLLSDQPGEVVEGAPDARTYAMEQFRLGHQCARSQLVFMPTGLTAAGVADPAYRAFLQDIEQRPRHATRLEVITTEVDSLIGEIVRKRDELRKADAPGGVSVVYLDVHQRDDAAAAVVKTYLSKRDVTWMSMPAGDNPPRAVMEMFDQAVKQVPLVLVIAGEVADAWVVQRVRAAMKAGIDREPPADVAVVRLPGRAAMPALPYNRTIVGDGVSVNESQLDALLADAAQAEA